MRIVVPVHSDPCMEETITLYEDGKTKVYPVAKKVLSGSEVLYILPDDFPLCMVKPLFGAEARIEEAPKRKEWKMKIIIEEE